MPVNIKNLDEIKQWYKSKKPMYSSLAMKVESIIKDVLDSAGITYYSISSRAKEIDSFMKKASKDKYNDPINQIQDLAGIRVITYVKSEVNDCCEVIKPLFKIDENNSADKSMELGIDRVGYRSVHYVATLTDDRSRLPEFKWFEGLTFEIQIRTILEHAWADIAHDRSYKFKGEFPSEYDIERRFALASATLELVDREFNSIVQTLDKYNSEVLEKTKQGDLDIPINTPSLTNYLSQKLAHLVAIGKVQATFNGGEEKVIDELVAFGINSIYELDQIIKDNPLKFIADSDIEFNYLSYLRHIMLFTDIDKYFDHAWKNNWYAIEYGTAIMLKHAGVNIDVFTKYGVHISVEDDIDIDTEVEHLTTII
ncbi:hypothetical protein BVG16_08095 [Paenibacillus selenitireducens]|uniref:RelA/SpoT domain-containing protein n=1 Tax=Paenibacillus selenitireducens TaxID=1324314 RepID=A0A1T2XGU5_9BACL|nr:RelA/SpoT domain-containing protein [Paenibacillus selenitireducens]OPA79055.1 hypothetical protein BVG16_08095 [Paenibacillus selenitireducens]